MKRADRMKDLARLAADERTPEGERRNAAMALAKMFNKEPSVEQDVVFETLTKQHAKLQVDFDIARIELDLLKKQKAETDAKSKELKQRYKKLEVAFIEADRGYRELFSELEAMTQRAANAEEQANRLRTHFDDPKTSPTTPATGEVRAQETRAQASIRDLGLPRIQIYPFKIGEF